LYYKLDAMFYSQNIYVYKYSCKVCEIVLKLPAVDQTGVPLGALPPANGYGPPEGQRATTNELKV
jgi:hypothetical protein